MRGKMGMMKSKMRAMRGKMGMIMSCLARADR